MEPQDINSLCRLCGTYSEKMIDVLNHYREKQAQEYQSNEPNILEIIHNCLPVQVYINERMFIRLSIQCNLF